MIKLQKYFGYIGYNGKYFNGSQSQNNLHNTETVQENLIVIFLSPN